MTNLLHQARREITFGLLSASVLPSAGCDNDTNKNKNPRNEYTITLASTDSSKEERSAHLNASWEKLLSMKHDFDTKSLELAKDALKDGSNLEELQKSGDALFYSALDYARSESAKFPIEDFTGIDRYKALEFKLYSFPPYRETYPILEALNDAPLEFADKRAFWWSFYRYSGVLDPGILEETLSRFENLYPFHKRDRFRYATLIGRMYGDIGSLDEATCMFEKAINILEAEDTLLFGRDTNFKSDPRAILAVDIGRLACTIASFKDDETRLHTLESFKERFGDVPEVNQEIDSYWQEYQLLYRPLPRIVGKTFEGKWIDTDLLAGKPLIIEFGASWCGPCQEALHSLKNLNQEFSDRISILGISADKNTKDLKDWIERENIPWPYLGGELGFDEPTFKAFDIGGIPYNIVVDSHGIVRQLGVTEEHLPSLIRRIIASGG